MNNISIVLLVTILALFYGANGQSVNYQRVYTPRVAMTDDSNVNLGLPVNDINVVTEYFDGLGRPIQSVNTRSSPDERDIVFPLYYNLNGLQDMTSLPFASEGGIGSYRGASRPGTGGYQTSEQYLFYQGTPSIVQDTKPYIQATYESSPLQRIKKQGFAGNLWQPTTNNTIEYQYNVNLTEEHVISWIYDETTGFVANSGEYTQGKLVVNVVKDENQNRTIEYIDKNGRTVLKKVQVSSPFDMAYSGWLVTYYVYDKYGNVVMVIPPEAFESMYSIEDYTLVNDSEFRSKWLFLYTYNDKNQLIEKKVPGALPTYLVYDAWDRLILQQDGNLSKSDQWHFFKYDYLNRIIVTGLTILTQPLADIRTDAVNQAVRYEEKTTTGIGYTLGATFPIVSQSQVLEVNYYDNYDFPFANFAHLTYTDELGAGSESLSISGFVTGRMVRLLDGFGTWLRSINYYDHRYRLIQDVVENNLSGTDKTSYSYNYSGQLIRALRYHQGHDLLTIDLQYEYDHEGRLSNVYHNLGTDPSTRILLAQMEYNELGELKRKYFHGKETSDGVLFFPVHTDYQYHIRGWLNSVKTSLDEEHGTGDTELFGMKLLYNQIENGFANQPLFNGNISAMKWRVNDRINTPVERIYGYFYDDANRLTKADFAARSGNDWSAETDHFSVKNIGYDKNGNITDLKRNSFLGALEEIDDLNYEYDGNQLVHVLENSTSTFRYEGFDSQSQTSTPPDCDDTPYEEIQTVTHNYLYDMESLVMGGGGQPMLDINGLRSSNYSYNGSYSMRVPGNGRETLEILVKPGDSLDISVWAFNNNESGEPYMRIEFVNSSNSIATIANEYFETINSWHKLIKNDIVISESGTIRITLREFCDCDEPVYFDDLSIVYRTQEAVIIQPDPCPPPDTVEIAYTYDANGNMASDSNKGIDTIAYNHLNLPSNVVFDANKEVAYLYDASGRKWQKTVADDTDTVVTDYQNGIHYLSVNGMVSLDFILTEEGRITFSGDSVQYECFVKDHLGNTRMTFKDITSEPGTEQVQVLSADYTYNMETDIMEGDVPYFRIEDGTRSDAYAYEGLYSMAMFDDFESIDIPVELDDLVDISVWVFKPTTAPTADISVRLKVGANSTFITGTTASVIGSWEHITFTDVAIQSNGTLQLRLEESSALGQVYYDNVNVKIKKLETRITGFIPEVEVLSHQSYYPFGMLMSPLTYRVVNTFMATMESGEAVHEESMFGNIEATRTKFSMANHTSEGDKVARLDARQPLGPSLTLKVFKGDTLHMETYAYYEHDGKAERNTGAIALASTIASTLAAGAIGAETGSISSAARGNTGISAMMDQEENKPPGAYLNYLLFNRNNEIVQHGFVGATEQANYQKEMIMLNELIIENEGYIHIYISNEGATVKPVYFDDLKIEHHTLATQEQMMLDEIAMMSSMQVPGENNYLYQGKELQPELETYDFHARMYDPALGRTFQQDPMSELFYDHGPYSWVKNNPLLRVDPTGMTDFKFDKKSGEITQVGEANDEPDRILKTNRRGEVKYKKNGKAKLVLGGIEKGILADGQNWKTDDQIIDVGGEGQASLEGVEDFITRFSERVGVEFSGAYLSQEDKADATISKIYIDEYEGNEPKQSSASFTKLFTDPGLKGFYTITDFHTHPSNIGASRTDVERPSGTTGQGGGDLAHRDNQKSYFYNFLILTRTATYPSKVQRIYYTNWKR